MLQFQPMAVSSEKTCRLCSYTIYTDENKTTHWTYRIIILLY